MIPLVVVLLGLSLVLSAFFATAELAIFSLGESRIRTLLGEGFRGSRALAHLRRAPEPLVALLRAGTTLADVAAAGAAAYLGHGIAGTAGGALGVLISFLLLLVVGKLVPMALVDDHVMRIALAVAPPLETAARAAAPLLRPVTGRVRPLPARPTPAGEGLTEDEIRQITALGRTEGLVGEHERQLIERAFRLDETKAWAIMTPRVDVFAWQDALTLSEIAPQLHTVPYSRVPLYGESIDDITGVLYLRDAYQALVSGQRDVSLRTLARQPLIVPGSVSLTKLLRDFQSRRIHLAIVVDEYGGTDGLVTLEDVLEELVGEIVDETDVAKEPILRTSRHEIVAEGDADLREINHIFNTAFPQLEHRSLNGYLLEEMGRVPEVGETLERDGIAIEVLEATETQVVRARLRRKASVAERIGKGEGAAPKPPPPPARRAADGGADEPPPEPPPSASASSPLRA